MEVANKVFSILGAIVVVAGITVLVTHPGTASDLSAFGCEFSNALRAAMGHETVPC